MHPAYHNHGNTDRSDSSSYFAGTGKQLSVIKVISNEDHV